jgi:DnaK suppressor protein
MAATKKKREQEKKIERQLVALEQRLVRELHDRLGNVQNTSQGDPSELLDLAAEGELDYMSAVSAEAGSATIDEIQQALVKLKEGTYGVCDACGHRIRARRLKARPFAVLCIGCKEKEERFGYVPSRAALAAREDASFAVSLTDEDVHGAGGPGEGVLRDVEDIEVNGLF